MTPESNEVRLARIEERLEAMGQALRLQAAEYERRLETLNGAHEEAREVAKTTVTAEKFEDYIESEKRAQSLALESIEAKVDDLAQSVRDNGQRISTVEGASRIKASTIGWVLAGMTILLAIIVGGINLLVGP